MPDKEKIMRGVAAVIFDRNKDYSFLILKKKGAWIGWQFVQGAIDKGETPEQAVIREVQEETGLKTISIAKKLSYKKDYWFKWEGEKVHKFLEFFLVKADRSEKVTTSEEHSEYKWCSYKDALAEIKFNKEIFERMPSELEEIEKKGLQKGLGEFGK